MKEKNKDDSWVICPECKTKLKQENFTYHMKHVHNKKIDDAKIKPLENSYNKRQENKTPKFISKRTIAIIIIIFIILITSISIYFLFNYKYLNLNGQNNKKNYFVSIDGKGNYTSIQKAIDSASNNDTIIVSKGTYFENIKITKPIELIGENKNTTIINGNGSGSVINISADYVKISGFTIKNGGSLTQTKDAGIKIGSNYNTISDCEISSNKNYGIYLGTQPKATNNTIKNNIFYYNSYGIYTSYAKTNNISSNKFTNNTIYGIYLLDQSNNNLISNNIFTENNYAIRIRDSTINTIIKNLIMNNQMGLMFCCGAINNIAYYNVFINNTYWNAEDAMGNIWDNGKVGNYWDDYNGTDANGDGIGDTPYLKNLKKGGDGDRFPLMKKDAFQNNFTELTDGKSIQEAIDSASDNETIFINKGTYFENIKITKPIELIGENKNTTIINGYGSGSVINISADYVKISGFTITNGGPLPQKSDAGIMIRSSYNTISDCNISSNKNYGIYLYPTLNTTNNIIKNNTFFNNKFGLYGDGAKINNISSNTFTGNTDYGLYLLGQSDSNLISDNIFTENKNAIRIKSSTTNTVIKNLIMNNKNGTYFCCGATNNIAYYNVFINNTNWNANDAMGNIWDNGKVGNYWDDYNGTDANGDGIGDTPYLIGGDKGDNFPLMKRDIKYYQGY